MFFATQAKIANRGIKGRKQALAELGSYKDISDPASALKWCNAAEKVMGASAWNGQASRFSVPETLRESITMEGSFSTKHSAKLFLIPQLGEWATEKQGQACRHPAIALLFARTVGESIAAEQPGKPFYEGKTPGEVAVEFIVPILGMVAESLRPLISRESRAKAVPDTKL